MEENKTYIYKKKDQEIWVTNCNRSKDMFIDDLGITVRRGVSINLLNGRYPYITEKDIQKSIESGALKRKEIFLKVRIVPPVFFNTKIITAKKGNFGDLRQLRSIKPLEERTFEDLDFADEGEDSDEEFAMENAEMEMMDRAPLIPVDPKLKQ
jgi:hypothetical protein